MITCREDFPKLINTMGLKIGAEIGSQKGLYAKYLLENTDLFLYLVDAWQHIDGYKDIANVSNQDHATNLQNLHHILGPYKGRYQTIKAFSVDAAKEFEENSLDFVYIDADHRYSETLKDLGAWYPKVRVGGLFAGHDFLDGENICGSEFGVKSAVTEFLSDKNHKLNVTAEAWPNWWIIKED